GQEPGRRRIGELYQRIVTGDMKHRLRRAVRGVTKIERQRGCDRLVAVPRASGGESARLRERKACGAIGFEHRRRVHSKLLRDVGAARSNRVSFRESAAERDPAAEAMISSADDRPYRDGA